RVTPDGETPTEVEAENFGSLSTDTWYFVEFWHDADADEIGIAVDTAEDTEEFSAGVSYPPSSTDVFYFNPPHYELEATIDLDSWIVLNRVPDNTERAGLWNSGDGVAYWNLFP